MPTLTYFTSLEDNFKNTTTHLEDTAENENEEEDEPFNNTILKTKQKLMMRREMNLLTTLKRL